jgi:hypothetical protein
MQNIVTETDLRVAILQLEIKQAEEGKVLKEQFLATYESIKPINLIRSIFTEAAESKDLQDNLVNTTIGLSAGYLSKVLFQGISGSPIKKFLGTALMFGIKNLVAQNPEAVKTWGRIFFKIVKNLLREKKEKIPANETWETAGP